MLPFPAPPPLALGPMMPMGLNPLADPAIAGLLGVPPPEPERAPADAPPKPTKASIIEVATRDREAHQLWLTSVVAPAVARYWMETSSVFEVDRAAIKKGEMERFVDNSLRDEADRGIAWLAGHKLGFHPSLLRADARRETQDKADFLHFLYEEEQRQHEESGRGDFDHAIAWTIMVIGSLAAIDLPDPSDPRVPFIMELLDPTVTYPLFENAKKSMRHCSIWRTAMLADVISRYDIDGALARDLYGMKREPKGDEPSTRAIPEYRPDSHVDLLEWFDRKWRAVLIDDILVVPPTEHYCEEVPITYVYGNLGAPSYLAPPMETGAQSGSGEWATAVAPTTRERQIANAGLPHIWASIPRHNQSEMVHTRLFNEVRNSNNRPRYIRLGPLSNRDDPKWDMRPGSTNFLETEEEMDLLSTAPDPSILGPILQALGAARMTNLTPPQAATGQLSASAVESIQGLNHERYTHAALAIMQFHRMRAEKRLRLWMRDGPYLGDPRGTIVVPRRRPRQGQEPSFVLLPETVRETGWRVEAKLTNPDKKTLGPLGNAANIWVNGKMASKRTAMEWRDEEDPDAEQRDIEIEDFYQMPEMKMKRLIDYLVEEGDMAGAELVAELLAHETEKRRATMQPPDQMGAPPPGPAAPDGGSLPGPAQVPGLSLPALGMGPGPGTGPVGPTGPQGPPMRPEMI